MTRPYCSPCSGGALRRSEGVLHWLVQAADAYPALGQGQAPLGLLHSVEAERLAGLTLPKRRADWLLGRWTAKHLLQSTLQHGLGTWLPLNTLVIHNDRDGAPYACVEMSVPSSQHSVASRQPSANRGQWAGVSGESHGIRLPVSLSISHSGTHAFCAVSDWGLGIRDLDALVSVPNPQSLISVGADIERVERRGPEFVTDFFTDAEQAEVEAAEADQRDTVITTLWSAKEAVLKALHLGLTVDTRRVTCSLLEATAPGGDGWAGLTVAAPDLLPAPGWLSGWWRTLDGYVLTLVVKYAA